MNGADAGSVPGRKKRDSADLSGGRTGNTGDRPDTGRKEYGQCICRKN